MKLTTNTLFFLRSIKQNDKMINLQLRCFPFTINKTTWGEGSPFRNYRTCGPKFGFQNRTLTVQWKIGKFHTLTVYFNNEKQPLQCTDNFFVWSTEKMSFITCLLFRNFVKYMDFNIHM